MILPAFGAISHIVSHYANKPVFGTLGMIYGAPMRLSIRWVDRHPPSGKLSIPLESVARVAAVATHCGKALADRGVRLCTHSQDSPARALSKATIRNLIHLAGSALTYRPSCNNDRVAGLTDPCVQGLVSESTGTALPSGDLRCKGLTSTDIERARPYKRCSTDGDHRSPSPSSMMMVKPELMRTLGSNPLGGRRSVHSTHVRTGEGAQGTTPLSVASRSYSTTPNTFPALGAMTTRFLEAVKASKNKDGRYGNLLRIIGDTHTLTLAYLKIKGNHGALTRGVEHSTLDGMSLRYIEKVSREILSGTYRFSPTRVVEIPKPGKQELRPLGISNPRQKIVQAAIEMTLSAIFEPEFIECSHGFRPGRGTHSALKHLQIGAGNLSGYTWAIEGDIKGCFDNIPHWLILKGLRRLVDCPSTLDLLRKLLSAGYVYDTKRRRKQPTIIKKPVGVPQGLVTSPLLANIALHQLDEYILKVISPRFCKGSKRKRTAEFRKIRSKIKSTPSGRPRKKIINPSFKTHAVDPMDPDFRRLHYVRYADDWVMLVCGSYQDAVALRASVSNKLRSMGLELHIEKTKISHLRRHRCRFLGVDFFIRRTTDQYLKPVVHVKRGNTTIRQRANPRLILHAPIAYLLDKLVKHGFIKRNHLGMLYPRGKAKCSPLPHPQILNLYNSKIRGVLNYYTCVHNRMSLWSIVRFFRYSCALTLARKFKLRTLAKTFRKFGPALAFKNDKGKIYSIYRPPHLRMLPERERFHTQPLTDIETLLRTSWSKAMTQAQFDQVCALCGVQENLEIHHIRSIKKIRVKARSYAQWVGGFLRKSIPLCTAHHRALHAGQLSLSEIQKLSAYKGKMKAPSRAKS